MKPAMRLAVLALLLTTAIGPSVHAARTVSTTGRSFVRLSDLADDERDALTTLATTAIKKDITDNLNARIYEAAASNDEPAMSAETRAAMARGAYILIQGYLAPLGIQVHEYDFIHRVGKMLNKVAALGLFPHAFTVGHIVRIQAVGGVAFGFEFNFYVEKGVLRLTGYSLAGAQLGVAAKASEQFYVALCYGECTGGEGAGFYTGADWSVDSGLGFDAYVEFGIDFTDAINAWFKGQKYSLKELYDTHTFYIGMGIDNGIGEGWSGHFIGYSNVFDVALANLNGRSAFNPDLMAKYDLRKYR